MDDRLALFRIGLARSARIEQRQRRTAASAARVAALAPGAASARTSLWKREQRDLLERARSAAAIRDAVSGKGASAPGSTPVGDGSTPSATPVSGTR